MGYYTLAAKFSSKTDTENNIFDNCSDEIRKVLNGASGTHVGLNKGDYIKVSTDIESFIFMIKSKTANMPRNGLTEIIFDLELISGMHI